MAKRSRCRVQLTSSRLSTVLFIQRFGMFWGKIEMGVPQRLVTLIKNSHRGHGGAVELLQEMYTGETSEFTKGVYYDP